MNVYRIVIEQDHPDYTYRHKQQFDVLAGTASVALRKALRLAAHNGFHPRRRYDVSSLVELVNGVAR